MNEDIPPAWATESIPLDMDNVPPPYLENDTNFYSYEAENDDMDKGSSIEEIEQDEKLLAKTSESVQEEMTEEVHEVEQDDREITEPSQLMQEADFPLNEKAEQSLETADNDYLDHDSKFEQIKIEFGRVKTQEQVEEAAEEVKAETSEQPLFASTEQNVAPQPIEQETFRPDFNRGLAPEKIGGEIHLDYTFERFNANSEYEEVKKSKLNPLNILDRNEAVFEHKNDGSRITIKKDKIICDNTERNIHAALDIAQDKGWDVIKITGGSKAAKAEMWFEANMRGLETKGYEPSDADKKRLLGAQERARKEQEEVKGQSLADALDIKPKPKARESSQVANAAPIEAQSSVKTAATQQTTIPDKEQTVTQQQYWQQVRKEIMAEVEKFFPLDEKEHKQLENAIDNQLSLAVKAGKNLDVKQFKENIRGGLPTIRQELDAAAQMEQRQARAAEQQQQKRKPEIKER